MNTTKLVDLHCQTLQQLFAHEDVWTKGTFFRDESGEMTIKQEAVKCCIIGGIEIVYGLNYFTQEKLITKVGGISKWNDDPATTIEDIRRVCKELDI